MIYSIYQNKRKSKVRKSSVDSKTIQPKMGGQFILINLFVINVDYAVKI